MKWCQEEKAKKKKIWSAKKQNPPLIQILIKSLQLDQVSHVKETWESGQTDEI